jgi:GNAT superfamily N-acetyltransferase
VLLHIYLYASLNLLFLKTPLPPKLNPPFLNLTALLFLATHHDYHGKGAGSYLLKSGTERANREGARCYLEATKAGNLLYLKFGWKPVDEVVLDLEPFGGDGGVRCAVMVREGRGLSE